ncbi:amino acid/polyamine/organocation transporter (APC superfamily) [Actinocorallia herbida]|uniref:Amino acid/polyamine/organocation transporter (APC superfamily) n=1 Tax=Actinocorallia herbida TaxID=58109 RepID=A0A3N1D6T7_9ACTN|nr:APC family permease [Actinocorallia herbida]ROO89242.1 amino acid/polyamine/organocation transporter (APC superfamily) [Actinocorallia herbida]
MSKASDVLKRVLLGRALRSTQAHHQLLPKRIALPVFASDALSSVAYAPQEILITLGIAGLAGYAFTPWIGLAVVVLLVVVVASYRQNVRTYTSGGGDFEVATTNLGGNWGLVVASALLVDYVMTVAVSISSAVSNLSAFTPLIAEHRVLVAVTLVVLLTVLNLRGLKESGIAFAIPTYLFMFGIFSMMAWGFIRMAGGADLESESAHLEVHGTGEDIAGLAMIFLLLRAFASGCAALTGVEAISNGVPAFRKPKGQNAATTLLMLGVVAATMFAGVTALAYVTDAKYADPLHGSHLIDPATGRDVSGEQHTVITQVAETVFSNFPPMYVFVTVMTALILVLAANTAYNGFPVLASVLAQNRYLPRQLHTRGDRLAFSNGIIMLAGAAIILIYAFEADVTKLIQLYIVGVFVSFTVSQTGMVRHWNRLLRTETDSTVRRQMKTSRMINSVGLLITGAVLVVVLITKFSHGAWIVCIAMPALFILMRGIRAHYDRVARELEPDGAETTLPSRTHAIVLVSKIHKPTLRALAYARASRPSILEAVSVAVDADEAERLRDEWDALDLPVPLKVLDSPYREITRPVLEYVKNVRRKSPRDVVAVYIPEYVVGHWWEHILHNQSALRLKGRLLFQPGVMVTSVPWQLASSDRLKGRVERPAPGAVRRGDLE